MQRITVDAGLPAKLPTFKAAVELCDPDGKVLGKFIPSVDMTDWEPITPGVSDEELERRANSNERRYTFDEVRAHLRNLEQ